MKCLTGKELRFAAENNLPVRWVYKEPNPDDKWKNENVVCVMEKANVGYYIGNSDIVPDDYTDDEEVNITDGDGVHFEVRPVKGVKYHP